MRYTIIIIFKGMLSPQATDIFLDSLRQVKDCTCTLLSCSRARLLAALGLAIDRADDFLAEPWPPACARCVAILIFILILIFHIVIDIDIAYIYNALHYLGPSNTGGVKYRDFEICP